MENTEELMKKLADLQVQIDDLRTAIKEGSDKVLKNDENAFSSFLDEDRKSGAV